MSHRIQAKWYLSPGITYSLILGGPFLCPHAVFQATAAWLHTAAPHRLLKSPSVHIVRWISPCGCFSSTSHWKSLTRSLIPDTIFWGSSFISKCQKRKKFLINYYLHFSWFLMHIHDSSCLSKALLKQTDRFLYMFISVKSQLFSSSSCREFFYNKKCRVDRI